MEISNNYSPAFKAKILSTKAKKEVKEYAARNGLQEVLSNAYKHLNKEPAISFNIKHKFMKKDKLVKTELRWIEKDGSKRVYIVLNDKTKNPSEATFNIIIDFANKTGKAYNDIFKKQ